MDENSREFKLRVKIEVNESLCNSFTFMIRIFLMLVIKIKNIRMFALTLTKCQAEPDKMFALNLTKCQPEPVKTLALNLTKCQPEPVKTLALNVTKCK